MARHLSHTRALLLYLLYKVLGLCAIALQFGLMTQSLGIDNVLFGVKMVNDYIRERDWIDTALFPRITLCDFTVRVMGNVHNYTVGECEHYQIDVISLAPDSMRSYDQHVQREDLRLSLVLVRYCGTAHCDKRFLLDDAPGERCSIAGDF